MIFTVTGFVVDSAIPYLRAFIWNIEEGLRLPLQCRQYQHTRSSVCDSSWSTQQESPFINKAKAISVHYPQTHRPKREDLLSLSLAFSLAQRLLRAELLSGSGKHARISNGCYFPHLSNSLRGLVSPTAATHQNHCGAGVGEPFLRSHARLDEEDS